MWYLRDRQQLIGIIIGFPAPQVVLDCASKLVQGQALVLNTCTSLPSKNDFCRACFQHPRPSQRNAGRRGWSQIQVDSRPSGKIIASTLGRLCPLETATSSKAVTLTTPSNSCLSSATAANASTTAGCLHFALKPSNTLLYSRKAHLRSRQHKPRQTPGQPCEFGFPPDLNTHFSMIGGHQLSPVRNPSF